MTADGNKFRPRSVRNTISPEATTEQIDTTQTVGEKKVSTGSTDGNQCSAGSPDGKQGSTGSTNGNQGSVGSTGGNQSSAGSTGGNKVPTGSVSRKNICTRSLINNGVSAGHAGGDKDCRAPADDRKDSTGSTDGKKLKCQRQTSKVEHKQAALGRYRPRSSICKKEMFHADSSPLLTS